jgi:hypothetical protein
MRGQDISNSGTQKRLIPGLPALAGSEQFRHDIDPLPVNRQSEVIARGKIDLPEMRLSAGNIALDRRAGRKRPDVFGSSSRLLRLKSRGAG